VSPRLSHRNHRGGPAGERKRGLGVKTFDSVVLLSQFSYTEKAAEETGKSIFGRGKSRPENAAQGIARPVILDPAGFGLTRNDEDNAWLFKGTVQDTFKGELSDAASCFEFMKSLPHLPQAAGPLALSRVAASCLCRGGSSSSNNHGLHAPAPTPAPAQPGDGTTALCNDGIYSYAKAVVNAFYKKVRSRYLWQLGGHRQTRMTNQHNGDSLRHKRLSATKG